MLYIEHIVLYCLKQLNGERTVYSILHLLNGKKSSQTIQDAHLFHLKRFFGIYDLLTRETFENIVKSMHEGQLIYSCGEDQYLPSKLAIAKLEDHPLPKYFHGWDYSKQSSLFWERLSLFIQVISNFAYEKTKYTPIQKDKETQIWLKFVLKQINISRTQMGSTIYDELVHCLEDSRDLNPFVMIYRLTGSNQIGLTSLQTAKKLNMDDFDYHLEFLNILHYLINTIQMNRERYNLLALLLPEPSEVTTLTHSTRRTLELLNEGLTLEQIAANRKLKISTIEDHIVELAINMKDFSIDSYVEKELQQKVMDVSKSESTKQLKVIREKLKSATYFQIRLCLAKCGVW